MIDDYDPIFQKIGAKYGIDPLYLKAQAQYESGGDPNFRNPASSASGLGAIIDSTAKELGVDRSDPESSIDGLARYNIQNYQKFKDHSNPVVATVSAYKTGPNAGAIDANYANSVLGIYNSLRAKQSKKSGVQVAAADVQDSAPENQTDAAVAPSDDTGISDSKWTKKVLSFSDKPTDNTDEVSPQPDSKWAQKVLKYVDTSTPSKAAPKERLDLSSSEISDLQEKDPTAYHAYMSRKAELARGEATTGLGDVPRSVGRLGAAVAPDAFDSVVKAAVPAYAALTGQPQPTEQELAAAPPAAQTYNNALKDRNAEFENQYGNDPSSGSNRLVGQIAGSAPITGAVNKAIGTGVNALTKASPTIAQWVGESPLGRFLTNNVASDAVTNPATGAVTKTSSLGNKLSQYAASGVNAAEQAVPLTGLTNAGLDQSIGDQLKQNMAVGGVLGAAGPAIMDTGLGGANYVKNKITGAVAQDPLGEKAGSIIHELTGGLPEKVDTTEYVPGSKPSLAKAAAYAGDKNAGNLAALEKTLSESKVGGDELHNTEFRNQEQANHIARRNHVLEMTGTPDDITTLQQERSSSANALMGSEAKRLSDPSLPKGEVWQNNAPADVSKALDFIKNARKGPAAGNAGLQSKLDNIEKLLKDPQAQDPQYLYESVIKPQITDVLDNTNPFNVNNATKSQLPYIKQLKGLLDESVATSAPKYKGYLNDYSTRSSEIERLQGLQKLGIVNPEAEESVPTLNKVNNALKKIQEGRKNIDPTDPYKSIKDEDVNKLRNLQKDLEREQSAQKLVAAKGSDTSPKLQMAEKVRNKLNTASRKPGIVTGAGTGLGTLAGGVIGEHVAGPWGAAAGASLGADVGTRLGSKAESFLRPKANTSLHNKLVEMMLDPATKAPAISAGSAFLRRAGEMPQLQQGLANAAPYLGLYHNQLANRAGVSGTGNTK